jgi:hypothetical protein
MITAPEWAKTINTSRLPWPARHNMTRNFIRGICQWRRDRLVNLNYVRVTAIFKVDVFINVLVSKINGYGLDIMGSIPRERLYLFIVGFRTVSEPMNPIYNWISSSRINVLSRFLTTYFNLNSKLRMNEALAPLPLHTSMTSCLETGTILFNYFRILFWRHVLLSQLLWFISRIP